MKMSIKNHVRKIVGFLVFLLAAPIFFVLWIILCIADPVRSFLDFFRDLFDSLTDPEYIPPIGYSNFCALQAYWRKAVEAEAKPDRAEALKYWKKCAALYDTNAMLHVASYYENPENGSPDPKTASDFHALAASFGNPEAKKQYALLTGHELTDPERDRVREFFAQNRRAWLQD